jgi:putative FmdB family regulatory protein
MPIFEYVCACCGEKFERLRRFSDKDEDIKCARCGKSNVNRVLSTFSTATSAGSCTPSTTGSST